MFLGAVSYPVLVASFFYLNDYLYYSASALLGLGAAILWSAQVKFGGHPQAVSAKFSDFWTP